MSKEYEKICSLPLDGINDANSTSVEIYDTPSEDTVHSDEEVDGLFSLLPQEYGIFISTPSKDDIEIEHQEINRPSSPLLLAIRGAVDSLNQYDDFDILNKIGSGFFADVFKVKHKPTGEVMVLKRNRRGSRVSLLKEVELLKSLQHPNILHFVGACIYEGQLHPLTEYVSGGTLEDRITDKIEFPWSMRVHLSLDVASGMEYLHQHNMLHRDLNSHNVLLRKLSSQYTAVVADFGLAKTVQTSVRKLMRSGSIVGTAYWMAPEVLQGKPYNETADVFSYGITLCEVISRLSADPEDIPRTKDYGLNMQKFQTLPEVVQGCPREFMELAFMTCRLQPEERPLFTDIKTHLCKIKGTHSLDAFSQERLLGCTDYTIKPQPRIRLSVSDCHDFLPPVQASNSTEAIPIV